LTCCHREDGSFGPGRSLRYHARPMAYLSDRRSDILAFREEPSAPVDPMTVSWNSAHTERSLSRIFVGLADRDRHRDEIARLQARCRTPLVVASDLEASTGHCVRGGSIGRTQGIVALLRQPYACAGGHPRWQRWLQPQPLAGACHGDAIPTTSSSKITESRRSTTGKFTSGKTVKRSGNITA
jgi:hypothetical protein